MAAYFKTHDPYGHLVVIHTYPEEQDKVYTPLLGDKSILTGAALQNDWKDTHKLTLHWLRESAGRASRGWWPTTNRATGITASCPIPATRDSTRRPPATVCTTSANEHSGAISWPAAWGVEYYFGYELPESDLHCQDYRSRDKSWEYGRMALEFFAAHVPFWEMTNRNDLIGNPDNSHEKYCLAKEGEVYVVYLGYAHTTELDLGDSKDVFTIQWYNPRTGGNLQTGCQNNQRPRQTPHRPAPRRPRRRLGRADYEEVPVSNRQVLNWH
jgi:hypothetical protein